jgi:hypothetical protein
VSKYLPPVCLLFLVDIHSIISRIIRYNRYVVICTAQSLLAAVVNATLKELLSKTLECIRRDASVF